MTPREFWGGIAVLVLVAVGLFIVQSQMDYKYRTTQQQIQDTDKSVKVRELSEDDYDESGYKNSRDKALRLQTFDPNTVSRQKMENMGMPPKLIHTLLNFRQKGGRFYKKEDIKKLYAFKEEWYPDFAPYIVISKKNNAEKYSNSNYPKTEYTKRKPKLRDPLNINTCTVEQLDAEWGVSPKVAQNIVKYRDKLGGYHDMSQLSEVYTLPDSVLAHNTNWYVEGPVKKININTADFKTLNNNPYIRKARIVKSLISYRKAHGSFSSVEELLKIKNINEEKLQKLRPYLTVN